MTRHFDPNSLQFYITMPAPCPYLPDQMERKAYTPLDGLSAGSQLSDFLTHSGFRRSQNVLYRPACETCQACRSLRIKINEFTPQKSFKRILKTNENISRTVCEPYATKEQFELLARYLSTRHKDGGMSDMDFGRYEMMVEDCAVHTQVFEYRNPQGRLIACSITDPLIGALSMVYSFFDVDMAKASLGTYMVLDHIKRCRELGFAYLYLGYWVKGSPKMAYKARFHPHEILGQNGWEMPE